MNPPHVTSKSSPRSSTLTPTCPGERIADSVTARSTDVDLGHATFCTLEDATVSALTDAQAGSLGRLVRKLVNGPGGLPGGFDTVEDLCRSHIAAQLAAPSTEQVRVGMQRTLDLLRTLPS